MLTWILQRYIAVFCVRFTRQSLNLWCDTLVPLTTRSDADAAILSIPVVKQHTAISSKAKRRRVMKKADKDALQTETAATTLSSVASLAAEHKSNQQASDNMPSAVNVAGIDHRHRDLDSVDKTPEEKEGEVKKLVNATSAEDDQRKEDRASASAIMSVVIQAGHTLRLGTSDRAVANTEHGNEKPTRCGDLARSSAPNNHLD